MVVIKGLIWDEWNKAHIAEHKLTVEEVEDVCHSKFEAVQSYRKRIQISGNTKNGKKLIIILSPEDRKLHLYPEGIYYPITAFYEEVK